MIKARKGVNNNAAIITISALLILVGGERGIRTPELVTVNSFRDCRIQPLCHLSECKFTRMAIGIARFVEDNLRGESCRVHSKGFGIYSLHFVPHCIF